MRITFPLKRPSQMRELKIGGPSLRIDWSGQERNESSQFNADPLVSKVFSNEWRTARNLIHDHTRDALSVLEIPIQFFPKSCFE